MSSAENLTQTLTTMIPLLNFAQFKVVSAEPGRVYTSMPLEPNRNHLGSVYAGSLVSMAEASGGALLLSALDLSRYRLMVRNISIDYHRLALTDVHCDLHIPADFFSSIEEQCSREGKAFYLLPVEVRNAAGEVVATARLEYRLKLNA